MHCVAGTDGAAFAPGLALPDACLVVDKGTHRDREAYSAFDGTALGARLVAAHVRRLWVAGLATDYCVAATARDALTAGLEVVVLTDAVRGVDVARDDSERTLTALRAEGVQLHPGGPPKRDS